MRATSKPISRLDGALRAPGDKSCSHRALMFAGLAEGTSFIEGLLEGEDVKDTAKAMAACGADVERISLRRWKVTGVGAAGLKNPKNILDMGNSGTGARLMMGLVAGQKLKATFDGDVSLRSRPMGRVLDPLAEMGAKNESNGGKLPLTLEGAPLSAIEYTPPHASAQVKSCVMLAGLGAIGTTIVNEPRKTRDHTERMLRAFGVTVDVEEKDGGCRISLEGGQQLTATNVDIPGDPSSATFLWAAGLLVQEGSVSVLNVMENNTRDGLVHAAKAMGANLNVVKTGEAGGEVITTITSIPSSLNAATPELAIVPAMIDEFPLFGVLAAFADGDTLVTGAEELRVKESDRITATVNMLKANGVHAEERPDGFIVRGCGRGGVPGGGIVEACHDHRIAMSALVMGCAAKAPVSVDNVSAIATSYPDFFAHMQALGADIEQG
ncbi:3-phosphoshikimate 1-carboxyvinyltransferase [Hirschia baltica]|uniref:3-phosphoshikimate 1-carboxyvinyltransferase n=1 Tax=Hirschia baltica (strain ATCC 49814 / DSM 5838 / IFAM 1418) TaxID=582402 RepID=C6XN88_HIRBI|nr:3-phosphoshikimate 1-carboxyvinyltransferase [Hirschia baltica]ACT60032.1 3-phosphoshikimate 1-carboxyvinyltransferase [Hirschia baltica ATCC 49814]